MGSRSGLDKVLQEGDFKPPATIVESLAAQESRGYVPDPVNLLNRFIVPGLAAGPGQLILETAKKIPGSDDVAKIFGFNSMDEALKAHNTSIEEVRKSNQEKIGKVGENLTFHGAEALPSMFLPQLAPETFLGSRALGSALSGAQTGALSGSTSFLDPKQSRTTAALFGSVAGGLSQGTLQTLFGGFARHFNQATARKSPTEALGREEVASLQPGEYSEWLQRMAGLKDKITTGKELGDLTQEARDTLMRFSEVATDLLAAANKAPKEWHAILKSGLQEKAFWTNYQKESLYQARDELALQAGPFDPSKLLTKLQAITKGVPAGEHNAGIMTALQRAQEHFVNDNPGSKMPDWQLAALRRTYQRDPNQVPKEFHDLINGSGDASINYTTILSAKREIDGAIARARANNNRLSNSGEGGKSNLDALFAARKEIDNAQRAFATEKGGPLLEAQEAADKFYQEQFLKIEENFFKQGLKKATPEELGDYFVKKVFLERPAGTTGNVSSAQKLYGQLDERSRAAVRTGILKEGIERATNDQGFQPKLFQRFLTDHKDSFDFMFKDTASGAQLKGLRNLLDMSGQGVMMNKMAPWLPLFGGLIGGGAGLWSHGAVPGAATGAVFTAGIWQGAQVLLKTSYGRKLLEASSKVAPNSPAAQKLYSTMGRFLSAETGNEAGQNVPSMRGAVKAVGEALD